MIVEAGHYALVLALVLSALQACLPLVGAARGDGRLMAMGPSLAGAQLLLTGAAFAALIAAYVQSDFSVANVVANSHSTKPLLYKVSAAWGNHEGSLLLWVLILALFGAAVAGFGGNLPAALKARVLSVQGMIATGFFLFIIFTSNPFARIFPPPMDGEGFNPLLQDPGLAFHPPFLYLGYVGFSITFAFAIAALIEGRVDPAWARWVRPWALAAWSFLTIGIALGSWWAYYELGWGGFWFWDPVENASFLPWLVGTALIHSASVAEKRDALKSWTILLAILAFSLSLVGTFLVRSGVLTSVHAFANDPERGLFILVLLAVAVGGAFLLYALRAPALKPGGLFAPISREGALVLNNLLLSVAAATVLLGTLYPLFLDALGGARISVGPPYFNATFLPLMLPLFVVMGFGPMLAWKRGDVAGALQRLRAAMGVAGGVAIGVLIFDHDRHILAAIALALAAWIAAGTFVELAERIRLFRSPIADTLARARGLPRAAYGMTVAHLGIAILIAGVTATSAWQTELIQTMRVGESVTVAGYRFTFEGVSEVPGANYRAERGAFLVERNGRTIAHLFPERRFYPVEQRQTTEAAIHTTFFSDLYAVVGDGDGKGGHVVRIYHNPLVPWIWIGAIVTALGGGISLTDRRHRVGAPARADRGTASQAAE